jgi:hypothetical protein
MTAHALGHHPSPGTRMRAAACELRARTRAGALDRQLAAGVPSWRTELHAARALQLTGPRHRRAVADTLERLERRSIQPIHSGTVLALIVPPCRASVRQCAWQIEELVALLRSEEPIAVEGMARLHLLLHDGTGPLYLPDHGGELSRALHQARRTIAVPG